MQLNNSAFVLICKVGFLVAVMTTGVLVALDDGDTSDPFTDYQEETEEGYQSVAEAETNEAATNEAETNENESDASVTVDTGERDSDVSDTSVALKPTQEAYGNSSVGNSSQQSFGDFNNNQQAIDNNDLRGNSTNSANSTTSEYSQQPQTLVPSIQPARQPTHQPAVQEAFNQPPARQMESSRIPSSQSLQSGNSSESPYRTQPNQLQGSTVQGTTQDIFVDPNLQPATYNQPVPSPPPVAAAPKVSKAPKILSPKTQMAENLLVQLKDSELESAATGQPMGLLDIMANSDMNRRKPLVQQYWKTYAAWASYRFAVDELRWIQQVGQVRTDADRSALEAAELAASDSITARALELSKQQNLLNQFMSGPRSASLPMPSDKPLVTRYRTNFEKYASQRSMPEKLRIIDELLPEQQKLIGDRAATVQACRNAVIQASRAVAQGQPVQSMLQSIELCRDCHTNFVETVVDYNQQIADYAMTVRPNKHLPEQVVAMLISTPTSSTTTPGYQNGQSRQATLQGTPYQQSQGVRNNGIRNNGIGNSGLPSRRSPAAAQQPAIGQPSQPSALAPRSNNPFGSDSSSSLGGSGSNSNGSSGGYRPPTAPPSSAGGGFRR